VADAIISSKPITAEVDAIAEALNREVVPVVRRLRERVTKATTVGDGVFAVFVVPHPFATLDVFVTVVEVATGADMVPPAAVAHRTGVNEVTVTFAAPPPVDGARVLVSP
jgi:hypothetical protein